MPLLARDASCRAHGKPNTTWAQEGGGGARILAEIEVDLGAILVAVVRGSHGAENVAVGGTEVVDLWRWGPRQRILAWTGSRLFTEGKGE